MMWRAVFVIVLFLSVSAVRAEAMLDQRTQELFKEIRCVVCQSQSLNDSHASIAEDMKAYIVKEIAAGKTDAEIKQELVGIYGESVLMTPPVSKKSYLFWLAPFALLLGGGLIVMHLCRK